MLEIYNEHKGFGKQLFLLAKNELIKTYKGAVIGPLWAVVKPLFTLFVYWFAFSVGLRKAGDVSVLINGETLIFERFIFMLTGFVPWFFINDAILLGSKSIRKNSQFVTKIYYPVSTIMTFTMLSRIIVSFMIFALAYVYVIFVHGVSIYNIQIIFYYVFMFVFFLVLSWSTAPMSAFSKDFESFITSVMPCIFWFTGIIYNSYDLPEPLAKIMLLNPINFFVNGFRNALIYDRWFFECKTELVIIVVEFVLLFFFGIKNYNRLRKKLPDVL